MFFRKENRFCKKKYFDFLVHTPKLDYQNPLNVILFIGGENLNGGESTELQPSAQLAKTRNCVFVSVSIRRSVLGFLSLENISKK